MNLSLTFTPSGTLSAQKTQLVSFLRLLIALRRSYPEDSHLNVTVDAPELTTEEAEALLVPLGLPKKGTIKKETV